MPSTSYGAINVDAPPDKAVPLLSPAGVAAKPFGYQTIEGMPSSLADAVPPGPLSEVGSDGASDDDDDEHRTTVLQSFIHLVKGFIGVGLLSLPWSISQLGVRVGVAAVFVMSYWASYNCWTVVRVKRYIEHQRLRVAVVNDNNNNTSNNGTTEEDTTNDRASDAGSVATASTNITYPDLGEWAYGKTFQSYVR